MDYKSQQLNSTQNQSQFMAQPSYSQPMVVHQIGQPAIVNAPNYGSDPMTLTCFNCRSAITTNTKKSPSALCCNLFGCWAMCCCCDCKDVVHRCPNCNVVLGIYSSGQDCC